MSKVNATQGGGNALVTLEARDLIELARQKAEAALGATITGDPQTVVGFHAFNGGSQNMNPADNAGNPAAPRMEIDFPLGSSNSGDVDIIVP